MSADTHFPAESFATVYGEYDALSRENAIDKSRRGLIRREVLKYLRPGNRILELNAGSGIDAEFFARKGFEVLATDISENAGARIREKSRLLPNLSFLRCDFSELEPIGQKKFDYIFSNFGGLNCTNDLEKIFSDCDKLLNPGGYFTLVAMPKIYPWEIASAFTGNHNAFRRFKKSNVAQVGGSEIRVWYHSPRKIRNAFPKNFRRVSTYNIGTFYPSAHFVSFARFPKLLSWLVRIDEKISASAIVPKGIGDYVIMTFQKKPA